MVIMDSTILLLLFFHDASPPIDEVTQQPLERCKERIELLIEKLVTSKTQIVIPTPVLSEILVASGPDKSRILNEIHATQAFKVQPFDEIAAIEVAMMTTPGEIKTKQKITTETKAKVKYNRQIIAIAKVNNITTIYSDDKALGEKARTLGITVFTTADLPAPQLPPQTEIEMIFSQE